MTFDPKRPLVMATAKTVLGHALAVGTPLVIVDGEPAGAGQVDEAMARRLHASKIAGYQDEIHATPVETPEQERNRLALEALRESDGDQLTPTSDLLVHADGPKAGKKVTRDDLIDIARREGVVIESDDNKPDMIRKITEARAGLVPPNGTNAEGDGAPGLGDTGQPGSTPRTDDEDAGGDAHGAAGEGPSDAD